MRPVHTYTNTLLCTNVTFLTTRPNVFKHILFESRKAMVTNRQTYGRTPCGMKSWNTGTMKGLPKIGAFTCQHPILYLIPKLVCKCPKLLAPPFPRSTWMGTCRLIPIKPLAVPLRGTTEKVVFAVLETDLMTFPKAMFGIVLVATLILVFLSTPESRAL